MSVIISPDLVVSTSSRTPPFPLNHARIGYKSILTENNVTASSQAAGFPASSLVNPLTYEQWRPTGNNATVTVDYGQTVDADYLGIGGGHNLSNVDATLTIEWSIDGNSWTTLKQIKPGNNSPIMLLFNTLTARYWRVSFSSTSPVQVGTMYIGESLSMQRSIYGGVTPITMARQTEFANNQSETNQFLGRSVIREGLSFSLSWKHLTARWYRDYFEPFVLVARERPFFIAWKPDTFPDEISFCWTTDDIVPTNMGTLDYMEVTINCKGMTDE